MQGSTLLVALACGLAGCQQPYDRCNLPPAATQQALASELEPTNAGVPLGSDVHAYVPSYPLWSDGAEKRRWVRLPEGARIDTAEPEDWRFPEGTTFYKEFARDGVRLETRVLRKVGPDDDAWAAMAYVWDGERAVAAPAGAQVGAHVVPSAGECFGCHGGRRARVLGFSAVQLDDDARAAFDGRFTRAVPPAPAPGHDVERRALGYLHANCSHCHNATRPAASGARCYAPQNSLDFTLHPGDVEPKSTAAYRTAVGTWVDPGDPDASQLMERFRRKAQPPMPPLGVTTMDPDGERLLETWIRQLQE